MTSLPIWTLRLCTVLLLARLTFAQVVLNISVPNYAELYRPLDYAVIGQQKSGTSTLWNILTGNPLVKGVSLGKELFWFSGEVPRNTLCDNHIEEYLRQCAQQRLKFNRTDLLIGDWSATYFSCVCCPVALRTLNPKLKVVVVLRDPVQRALSRFLEQKRSVNMPFHKHVANYTFAEYSAMQLDSLEACLARVTSFRLAAAGGEGGGGGGISPGSASGSDPNGGSDPRVTGGTDTSSSSRSIGSQAAGTAEGPIVGWGAGMDWQRWMEMQCYARENTYGWSVYDVFLENYLAHFPKEQILVLYTDDLASDPLTAVRAAEAFIGAPPVQYDPNRLSLVFNSRECYNWRCAKKHAEIRPATDSVLGLSAGALGQQEERPFTAALARLRAFYKPHMQRLFQWADEGRIARVPEAWRKVYGAD